MSDNELPKIKITMFSNAMSHHQKPFCDYLAEREDVDFKFVATKSLSAERAGMGYSDLNYSGDYIVRSYEDDAQQKAAEKLSSESDFVIYGSAPFKFIKNRIREKKWTFLYSERIFKRGIKDRLNPKYIAAYNLRYGLAPKKRLRVLCASAYAPKDFRTFGFKKNQMYKWGYFPALTEVSFSELSERKIPGSIIWVARMIPLKHPEIAIELTKKLKESGREFHLTIVGNGEMYDSIKESVVEYGLEEYVTLTGALPKDDVRLEMERSAIFIATSDYNEGWGAVINEGLSSACAVVASDAMGASHFLINDGENGEIYKYNDVDELYRKVSLLLDDPDKQRSLAEKGYSSMMSEWNGKNAGEKLVLLCRKLMSGDENFHFDNGILSTAEII